MSKLRNFHYSDYDRSGLDKTRILKHVASAVFAFKLFFSHTPTPKWDLDKLVVESWRDFVDLFRENDFQLLYDAQSFYEHEVLAMNMINEYDRKFPELGEDVKKILARFEAFDSQ
jgi:hypothetical protein